MIEVNGMADFGVKIEAIRKGGKLRGSTHYKYLLLPKHKRQ